MPKLKVTKKDKVPEENGSLTVGGKQVIASLQDQCRRRRYLKRFEEICEVINQSNRDIHILGNGGNEEVPTLSVGYIARAMGLNLSNDHVLRVVEMIEEENAASRGFVPMVPLREVLVDALMTGTLGGPAVVGTVVPSGRVAEPIPVIRDSEETIYAAFRAVDLSKRGYLEASELRHFLRGGAEPFTEEEVEEMVVAAADPENGRIYYEEFADVLATE